jgi:hypothetical protein
MSDGDVSGQSSGYAAYQAIQTHGVCQRRRRSITANSCRPFVRLMGEFVALKPGFRLTAMLTAISANFGDSGRLTTDESSRF